MSFGDVFIYN